MNLIYTSSLPRAQQRADSLASQLAIAQRDSKARTLRAQQSETDLQEELSILQDTLDRRSQQLSELKKSAAEDGAALKDQLNEAKARERATAEALHDETTKAVDLQSRLKASRETVLAQENSLRDAAEKAESLQAELTQLRKGRCECGCECGVSEINNWRANRNECRHLLVVRSFVQRMSSNRSVPSFFFSLFIFFPLSL